MKTPTLQEVKEYFKDAAKIKDHAGDIGFPEHGKFRVSKDGLGIIQNSFHDNWLVLWHKEKGYAKIIEYKNPKFEITKETILKYQMKDEFPEVFEVKLEVGEWYKTTHSRGKCLFCFTGGFDEDNYPLGYGFDINNKFLLSEANNGWGFYNCNPRKSTPKEAQQALEKEAVKRGLKKGVLINDIYNNNVNGVIISSYELDYEIVPHGKLQGNMALRDTDGNIIFINGTWAEIIPSITKQESEEKLKCKIV